jgi:ABC transport system ATP-binding/permease protein
LPPSFWHVAACHRRPIANLINAERVTVCYGTRTLPDAVSLGVDDGAVATK